MSGVQKAGARAAVGAGGLDFETERGQDCMVA
jgi:hypothetical protein